MATTKRKRRSTKHRGNAAGIVEARGRTGRRPESSQPSGRGGRRPNRFDEPPTWRGATLRAAFTTVLLAIVFIAIGQPVGASIAMAVAAFLLYIPFGYYTDLMFYRRRQAKKQRA